MEKEKEKNTEDDDQFVELNKWTSEMDNAGSDSAKPSKTVSPSIASQRF